MSSVTHLNANHPKIARPVGFISLWKQAITLRPHTYNLVLMNRNEWCMGCDTFALIRRGIINSLSLIRLVQCQAANKFIQIFKNEFSTLIRQNLRYQCFSSIGSMVLSLPLMNNWFRLTAFIALDQHGQLFSSFFRGPFFE